MINESGTAGAPRRKRADAQRNLDALITAAAKVFDTSGVGAPAKEIADSAGVGVGTLYRHFPTRTDLLAALVHRAFGYSVANARAAAEHPGPARDGVRAFFLATLRDREQFVLPLHGGPPVFTPATRERQAAVRDALRALLERGQAAGEVRADLTPQDLIITTSLLSRPLPGTGDWERLANRQIDLVIQGLSP
jgi:AcrR family transcriptional regulator